MDLPARSYDELWRQLGPPARPRCAASGCRPTARRSAAASAPGATTSADREMASASASHATSAATIYTLNGDKYPHKSTSRCSTPSDPPLKPLGCRGSAALRRALQAARRCVRNLARRGRNFLTRRVRGAAMNKMQAFKIAAAVRDVLDGASGAPLRRRAATAAQPRCGPHAPRTAAPRSTPPARSRAERPAQGVRRDLRPAADQAVRRRVEAAQQVFGFNVAPAAARCAPPPSRR